jgi:hypothetical protein
VNAFMAVTGLYQLSRKIRHDMEVQPASPWSLSVLLWAKHVVGCVHLAISLQGVPAGMNLHWLRALDLRHGVHSTACLYSLHEAVLHMYHENVSWGMCGMLTGNMLPYHICLFHMFLHPTTKSVHSMLIVESARLHAKLGQSGMSRLSVLKVRF